jgi:predicted RND superfamily exporter protein
MMADRITEFLILARWWLIAAAAVLLGLAWIPANRLEMDRRIEQMFPAGDPSVQTFELLRRRFGGNSVAMLVYHDPSLLTPEGVDRVAALADRAREMPGVLGVLSLAEVDAALRKSKPGGLFGFASKHAILDDEPLAAEFRQLFEGYTHDADGQFAALVAMLDPASPELHQVAIESLRQLGDSITGDDAPRATQTALVGEPVLVAEGFTLVRRDGDRLSTITIFLLGTVTLVMFRSPRWVLAELVVILWSVKMTQAAAVIVGLQLSMVSSMLTAIVTVIAVAAVIHVAVGYGVRRRRGDHPVVATRRTLSKLIGPIFWACVTDAAGFAALAISRVGPVRDFGLMMTLGTAMVLAAILLLLPGMMLCPPQKFVCFRTPGDRWIRRELVRSILLINRHRVGLAVLTGVVVVLTAIGLTRLETETNFIKNFREGSELAQSYAMVEQDFGGAGVWDIILPMPEQTTPDYLDSVRNLEAKLRELTVPAVDRPARLTKVLSIADADAAAGSDRLLAMASPTVRISGMRLAMPTFVDALITRGDEPANRLLRIMLRSPERLSAETKLALIDAVTVEVQRHTTTDAWRAMFGSDPGIDPQGRVTGYYVLLARLIERLLSDQWLCLLVAALVILAVIWVAFGSLRLACICMVPNLLPVMAVLGTIGLLGIRVNMGAAMIAAVSIGLTIDGSIHFLNGYTDSRKRGDSNLRSVLHAQRKVGFPVLLATIALAMGFTVLSTSQFVPTITFGVLVSAALIAGTLTNLTLLPLLLMGRTEFKGRGRTT